MLALDLIKKSKWQTEDMLTCLHGKVRLELVLNEYKVCHMNRHLYFMISISLDTIEWIKIEGSNVINLDIPATNGVVQVLESVVQVFNLICENEIFLQNILRCFFHYL